MSTKCYWKNGIQIFYDSSEFETVIAHAPVWYKWDFVGPGYTTVPAAGAAESGMPWVKKNVGAGAITQTADQPGGYLQGALDATSQKAEAGLYMNDERNFDITKGLVFEARILVPVLPTLEAEIIVGLIDNWTDGLPDTATYQALFNLDGDLNIRCQMDDNVRDLDVDSGEDAAIAVWRILQIDCSQEDDIKFRIDGNVVCDSTAFNYAATGANAILQPYIGVYKASGAGLGTFKVDYVAMWQKRS